MAEQCLTAITLNNERVEPAGSSANHFKYLRAAHAVYYQQSLASMDGVFNKYLVKQLSVSPEQIASTSTELAFDSFLERKSLKPMTHGDNLNSSQP